MKRGRCALALNFVSISSMIALQVLESHLSAPEEVDYW